MKEAWKTIPGFEGVYELSNLGRVKTYHRYPAGKIIDSHAQPSGH